MSSFLNMTDAIEAAGLSAFAVAASVTGNVPEKQAKEPEPIRRLFKSKVDPDIAMIVAPNYSMAAGAKALGQPSKNVSLDRLTRTHAL